MSKSECPWGHRNGMKKKAKGNGAVGVLTAPFPVFAALVCRNVSVLGSDKDVGCGCSPLPQLQ